MARSNKFVNPGKSVLLTVLSLILIIGIPGFVAYADSSDDTFDSFSTIEDLTATAGRVGTSGDGCDVADAAVTEVSSGSYQLDFTTGESASNSYNSVIVFTFATIGEFENLYLSFDSGSDVIEKVTVYIDSVYYEYTEGFDEIRVTPSAVEAASFTNYILKIKLDYVEDLATSTDYSETFELKSYSTKSIFTDDVVEMIVLVGGILLLICGTFSLSFIDVDTPGKAFRAAGRGIKKATRRH